MNVQDNKKGFTIIEVVLVLAIAGLIFLMVFIALPALQRGQRNTQRQNDVSQVATQVNNFQTSNRGAIPTASTFSNFSSQYFGPAGLSDPQHGDYNLNRRGVNRTATQLPPDGAIEYSAGRVCSSGASTTSGAGNRNFTLRIKLEGQNQAYCLDNR